MRLVTSLADMRALARDLRAQSRRVALVPTMGALHAGHLSLMQTACDEGNRLVVSVFVNPTQFGPGEDFNRYPRDLDRDFERLERIAPDVVFAPSAEEVYAPGFSTYVEPGPVAARWEGASRPGHFRGVCTVVLKLFNVINPDVAYFGQKDFQQAVIIRQMIADLNLPVRLVVCPTVREPDGLAISSRNAYLAGEDRQAAPVLHRSLRSAQKMFQDGETRATELLAVLCGMIRSERRASLDYAAIVDSTSLQPVQQVAPGTVALVAARVGAVRLIDNVVFGPAEATETELIELAMPRYSSAQEPRQSGSV
jgi:pantoate--beta-alanine ligase